MPAPVHSALSKKYSMCGRFWKRVSVLVFSGVLQSDHMRAASEIPGLCQLAFIYIHQSTVWVTISCSLLCNHQQQECLVQSCQKLQYFVCLPTNPNLYELWTFDHILELRAPQVSFHQLKCRPVNHFFHHYECFPTSGGICVPTNMH